MQFKKIVTILDKPKHAQSALDLTCRLREQADSDVELLSFCWSSLIGERTALNADERKQIKARMVKQRREWLQALLAGRQLNDTDVRARAIWTHDIAHWMADHTKENPTDLVIKSAHPSQTLLHTPLDWELLQTCPVPVLLTTTTAARPSPKKQRNVLAAIDLRHTDRRHQRLNQKVLQAANDYAQLIGAKLHCVSAVEVSTVLKDLDIVDPREVQRRLLRQSQEELRALLKPYDIPKTRQHFPIGKAGLAVNQVARKLKTELLVVGTNAKRARVRLGLGNSAQRILARAATDVLAVTP